MVKSDELGVMAIRLFWGIGRGNRAIRSAARASDDDGSR